jgi:hypothetical protein
VARVLFLNLASTLQSNVNEREGKDARHVPISGRKIHA